MGPCRGAIHNLVLPQRCAGARRLEPGIHRGVIIVGELVVAEELVRATGADHVANHFHYTTKRFLDAVHGVRARVFT